MTLLKSCTGVTSVISRFLLSKSKCITLNRRASSQVFPVNERWTRFTKVVHPSNVQMLDMVQGGEIMKFLETSADIAATKYCIKHGIKSAANKPPHPVLVGVERIEITGSAVVGDMLEFIGKVTHVTSRSLRISVDVTCHTWADFSHNYLMAKAWLWYVPITMNDKIGCFDVDSIARANQNVEEDVFVKQSVSNYTNMLTTYRDAEKYASLEHLAKDLIAKPREDLFSTMYSISPSVCSVLNRCQAGEILRWVDEFGAITAYKSSKHKAVTGSMDNCVIFKPVPSGSCITFVSRHVFSGSRSLDIQIIGTLDNHDGKETIFFNGFATYVLAKLKSNENFTLPALQPKTEEENETYKQRKILYETKKKYLKILKNLVGSTK